MSDSRPFGFYDHMNDVLYRGPLAWVEADKARMGGNKITALFDLSSAECLMAKRVAEIDEMRSALQVIHTWAGVPGALDAENVRRLTAKVLRI